MSTTSELSGAARHRLVVKDGGLTQALHGFNKLNKVPAPSMMDAASLADHILAEMRGYELQMQKLAGVESSQRRELEAYEKRHKEVEDKITNVRRGIETLKQELEREKNLRAQKEEYEEISRIINQIPSRTSTLGQIGKLNQQLSALSQELRSINEQMADKRKQFSLFFHSLTLLKADWLSEAAPAMAT